MVGIYVSCVGIRVVGIYVSIVVVIVVCWDTVCEYVCILRWNS